MANFQRWSCVGRLSRDPEERTDASGTYAAFTVVVNTRERNDLGEWADDSMHIDCRAYNRPGGRPLADVAMNCGKGEQHYFEGRLREQFYDLRGAKAKRHYVVIDTIEYLTTKAESIRRRMLSQGQGADSGD